MTKLIDLPDQNWTTERPGHEDIRTGCLLQVAREMRLLNVGREQLKSQLDRALEREKLLQWRLSVEQNRTRALRGHLTRLKRKLACAIK